MLFNSTSKVDCRAWSTLLRRSIALRTLSQITDIRMQTNELTYFLMALTSPFDSGVRLSSTSASNELRISGICAAKGFHAINSITPTGV